MKRRAHVNISAYNGAMPPRRIRPLVPFGETLLPEISRGSAFLHDSVLSFVRAVERKTGGELLVDLSGAPGGNQALFPCTTLAHKLQKAGIITGLFSLRPFPDEPRTEGFVAPFAVEEVAGKAGRGGGGGWHFFDAHAACMSALAEALERYLWKYTGEYFVNERRARECDLPKGSFVPLARFAGFSDRQRETLAGLKAQPGAEFLWIEGYSHVGRRRILVPAHVASAFGESRPSKDAPLVRPTVTTGLATAATEEGALVAGALEVIERDAFMVTYLNKIPPPRIDLEALAEEHQSLRHVLEQFKRYRLEAYAFSLLTDSPVHVVGAAILDEHGGPAFSMGAAARFELVPAIEKALSEALAGRYNIRARNLQVLPAPERFKIEERVSYWARKEHAPRMRWITEGPIEFPRKLSVPQTSKVKLEVLLSWCREKGYEFVSVDIGRSPRNPTDFSIQFVVIPELQPMHLIESHPCFGGARLAEVPRSLGLEPASELNAEPHPFP